MSKFISRKPRKKAAPVQWIVKPRRTRVLSFSDKLLDSLAALRSSFSLRRHGFALGVATIFVGGIAIGVGIGNMSSRHPAPLSPVPLSPGPLSPVVESPAVPLARLPQDQLPNFSPPQFITPPPYDAAYVEEDETPPDSFAANDLPSHPSEEEPEQVPGHMAVAVVTPPPAPSLPPPVKPIDRSAPPMPDKKPPLPRHPELASLPPPPEPQGEGMPQWQRNAVAAPKMDNRPRIALVIDDLGVDKHRSAAVIDLPGPLTTAFLSYASDLPAQTRAAHSAGHELLIHVPMEPKNPDMDPGPDALLISRNEAQLRHGLEEIFSRFPGYVGINNHMGSQFTGNVRGMSVVIGELKKRGLLFLDSRTSNDTVGPEIARRYGLPFAVRDVFIDNENDVAHVRARLAELERGARQRGYAIGIGHPRDATVEALRSWLPSLPRKGFVLVPVSSIVRQRATTTLAAKPAH